MSTLFEKLGGAEAVDAAVERFGAKEPADDLIAEVAAVAESVRSDVLCRDV